MKIKESSDYEKDPMTGALVNINASNLRSYRANRTMRRQLRKLQEKANRADALEARLSQLEHLVLQLTEKPKKGPKQ